MYVCMYVCMYAAKHHYNCEMPSGTVGNNDSILYILVSESESIIN